MEGSGMGVGRTLAGPKIVNTLGTTEGGEEWQVQLGESPQCQNDLLQGANTITSAKCIGMDVHKETISIAVMNSIGKLLMESIIETKAGPILQFFAGLRGDLHVT